MNMQSKKWLLGACSGALVVGAASMANAAMLPGLTIDLQITQIDGVNVSAAALPADTLTSKYVNLTKLQQLRGETYMPKLTVQVYAYVISGNTTRTDEGFQSVHGSLQSTKSTGIGAMTATILPKGTEWITTDENGDPLNTGTFMIAKAPFDAGGFTDEGLQQGGVYDGDTVDLSPQDGSLDRGSAPRQPNTGSGGYMVFRATSMQTSANATSVSNPLGRRYNIGAFDYQVTETREGQNQSLLNFVKRMTTEGVADENGAFFQVDGQQQTGTGAVFAGDAIVLETVPEPGSLALLGLGALGLLARSRRRS